MDAVREEATLNAGTTPDVDALRELTNAVEGEVRTTLLDRQLYATDASIYQVEPLAVVVPASIEDAARALACCARHGLPVLPRAGGTSLAGQGVNRAVVIDLSSRCDAIVALDTRARRCRVEPGVTIDDLNRRLARSGLFFAPDPSTVRQAGVGGCIGNNAAGARSVKYGRTSDHVLGVDLALSDGRRCRLDAGAAERDPVARELTERVADVVRRHAGLIRERFPGTLRRSAGYQLDVILDQLESHAGDERLLNLAPLVCGSEGTLGMTLGAELNLVPTPAARGLAVVAFDDLDKAIAAVPTLLELGPSAVELLDDMIVDLAKRNPEQRRHVELLPAPGSGRLRAVLYIEFEEGSDEALIDRLQRTLALFPRTDSALYRSPAEMQAAWALRRAGEPLLHAVEGVRKPLGFVEDNAVPPERLGEFVRSFREIVQAEGTIASFYAHASVGVLHVRPLLDLRDPADEGAMHRIAERAEELARSLGGVMSGEHGDGRARGPLLERYFGSELMGAFREIKAIFDPHGLMNPGNIVEPGPVESISGPTRVRAAERRHDPRHTFFDYRAEGGLVHASERCNGAGVCRQSAGAMCPAYQATRDERASTRGWGNALRLAITGQLGPGPAWADPEVEASLSLCLSCKACKGECPSNVDIAKLKAEYLAQSHIARGQGTRAARFYAGFDDALLWATRFPGLANRIAGLPITRAWLHRSIGLDPRRSLPKLTKPLRKRWGRRHKPIEPGSPTVVLLADAFTDAFEPGVGLATRRSLEAFGYEVELLHCGDLGRAKISVGMLGEAIAEIEVWLERFRPFLDHRPDVAAFVVCEPSCLSAIRDDWLELRCATPLERRQRFADRCFLPEQFLDRFWGEHPRRPSFRVPKGRVVVHGHCHQRALWGVGSSTNLLTRLFGHERVVVPEAGCCGMAGSYGYDADRYDLSMRIAEMNLAPTLALAGEDDVLVAAGTSCRHQALDLADKRLKHPIEVIADALGDR